MVKRLTLFFSIFLIGAAAVTSQILLIRELQAVFQGNELIYGLVLMLWLIIYAIGCALLGVIVDGINNKTGLFYVLQLLIAFSVPAEVFLARSAKLLFRIPTGMIVDLNTIFFISIIVLAPAALLLGFQFTLASKLMTEEKADPSGIGYTYVLEALGWVVFGALISLVLILFFNPFSIAALLSIALAACAAWHFKNPAAAFLFLLALFSFAIAPSLDRVSAKLSFQGTNLIDQVDSPFGRISVIRDGNTTSFFENGAFLFSTGDTIAKEELVHLALLQHDNPRSVLLIGGGFGGALNELNKYDQVYVDYVEADPKVIELAKKYIGDPADLKRTRTYPMDGISFLNETATGYDVIIVNLPDPDSALLNRFYTREFYDLCRRHLNRNGILTVKLRTSESFIGRELKALNSSIYMTLATVFPNVNVIPGNYNYFFASSRNYSWNAKTLIHRWRERNIKTDFFQESSLFYILSPRRLASVQEAIQPTGESKINSDLNPISYYLSSLVWASYFPSVNHSIFYFIMGLKWFWVVATLLAFILLVKALSLIFKSLRVPFAILMLSFAGMSGSILLIFTFQMLYGYVYQTVGIIISAYMAGLALGSLIVNLLYKMIRYPETVLRWSILIFMFFFSIFICGIATANLPLAAFFFSLPLGVAFPLAVKICEKDGNKWIAGSLFGADLIGGAAAALLVSIFLIPIYGVYNTVILLAILCFGAAWLI